MAEILLRRGDIELDRTDLDGAHIMFDDIPDRNIIVAESGQTYILNEAVGLIQRHGFSVHPITIEITGRTIRGWHTPHWRSGPASLSGDKNIRVRVFFDTSSPFDGNLATLFFGIGNMGRLDNMNHYYNLEYQVRPRIEDVEEYGE